MNVEPESEDHGYELEETTARPASRTPTPSTQRDRAVQSMPVRTPSRRSSDDWNEWKGLADALILLMLRSIVAIALWGGIVWLVTMVLLQLGSYSSLLVYMVSAAGGFAVGFVLTRGLADRAGFVGPILSVMACVAVIGCILAGTAIGSRINGAYAFGFVANMIAASVGCFIGIIKSIMDD